MLNYYFAVTIHSFSTKGIDQVIREITLSNQFDSNLNQNHSWEAEIHFLQEALMMPVLVATTEISFAN